MKRRLGSTRLVTALVTLAVLAGFAAPASSQAPPGVLEVKDVITSVFVPGVISLKLNDPAWNSTGFVKVTMPKVYRMLRAPIDEHRDIEVQSVHNGTDIFFYFRWADATQDTTVSDAPLFADAVAFMIPYSGVTYVPPPGQDDDHHMGLQVNPVNIVFWRADLKAPQNIVAGGKGTVQRSPDVNSQNIQHFDKWMNGQWHVIISRPMAASSQDQVSFVRGTTYPIDFANWDGSRQERDGNKFSNEFFWDDLVVQ